MTPKEKAKELVTKYFKYSIQYRKECALIAVDEILSENLFDDSEYANRRYKYYQEVKKEIEAL